MIRLSALIGQPAVSLATAERTGTVKGIAVANNRIVAVELSDSTIDAATIRSFEGDVLTYDVQPSSASTTGSRNPLGMRVLDRLGDEHGYIDDLDIAADGTIEAIILSTGQSMRGTRLRAVGTYAAIVNVELPPPTGQPITN